MEKIEVKTSSRIELVDITAELKSIVREKKIKNGICFLFCPHTTAGLTVNENADPDVQSDIVSTLKKLVPEQGHYLHAEGNSDSHLKSSLFGCSLTIFVEEGSLMLGSWQGIYFCESDGPRRRQVWVKFIKDA